MIILLVINVIGLFVTLVNVLLFIEILNNEKEISKERKSNLNYLDSINRELNSIVNTVDRNNLKYETQFNDIWHRIARKDEPLDPDEVNDQVQQYFNMLDNINMPGGTIECAKQYTTDQTTLSVTDGTCEDTKTTTDKTNLEIVSEEDNSAKDEEHE